RPRKGAKSVLWLFEWLAVLKFADKWCFESIRRLAIEEIDKQRMDEVEKITLIQEYDIKEWACATYGKPAIRQSPLTPDEMKLLGFEFSPKIADARE
ncbi:hypothetical protein BD410DRAFT_705826, partial [Rickenella mellea]